MATRTLKLAVDSRDAEAGFLRMKRGSRAATKAVAGLAAALAGGLATRAVVREFATFDSAMKQSLAIMGEVDAQMRRTMQVTAREVAANLNFSAAEAAEGYFFLASAGLDAAQSVEALPAVAEFARAGMFDLATATDLATDAQSALGLTVEDAQQNLRNLTHVTDVLVGANTLANATVQQFSEALTSEAGAAMKSFNIDIEEGTALLAAYADQGLKGASAGTSLRRVLARLTQAANRNSEEMEDLGIRVFDEAGGMRNLADIVADLENSLGGMSDAQRTAALESIGFTARLQGAILPILGMSDAIREYESDLREMGGTTEDVAEKQMQSLVNRLGSIKQAVLTSTIPAMSVFSEALIEATGDTDDLADAIMEITDPLEIIAQEAVTVVRTFTNTLEIVLNALDKVIVDAIRLVLENLGFLNRQLNRIPGVQLPTFGSALRTLEGVSAEFQDAIMKDVGDIGDAWTDLGEKILEVANRQGALEAGADDSTDAAAEARRAYEKLTDRLRGMTEESEATADQFERMADALHEMIELEARFKRRGPRRRLGERAAGDFGIRTGAPGRVEPGGFESGGREGAVDDETSALRERLQQAAQATEALSRGAGLLSDDAADSARAVTDLARGVGQLAKGGLGPAGAANAVFAIVGGLDSLIGTSDEAAQAQRRYADALREMQQASANLTPLEMDRARALEEARGIAEDAVRSLDLPSGAEDMFLQLTRSVDSIEEFVQLMGVLEDEFGQFGNVAEALQTTLVQLAQAASDMEFRFREDLRLRQLEAQGRTAEAEAMRLEIQHRREIQDARQQGLSEEAIQMLIQTQRMEELAQAREAEAEAMERQQDRLHTQRDFLRDLRAREASLAGRDIEAERIRLEAQAQRELRRASELLDAGKITEEMFERLARVLNEEVNQAIQSLREEAKRAAEEMQENLRLRELRATGQEKEAQLLRQELEHQQEIRDAIEEFGAESDLVAELRRIQQLEQEALREELRGQSARGAAGRRSRDRVRREVTSGITGISQTQAARLTDIALSQLTVLQFIHGELRAIRRGGAAEFGGGVGGRPTAEQIDESMGMSAAREARFNGDATLNRTTG